MREISQIWDIQSSEKVRKGIRYLFTLIGQKLGKAKIMLVSIKYSNIALEVVYVFENLKAVIEDYRVSANTKRVSYLRRVQ